MDSTDQLITEANNLRNQKGNLHGALEKVEESLTDNPKLIEALILKSILLRDLGELAEARSVLNTAAENLNGQSQVRQGDIQRLRGFLDLLQGDHDSALLNANKSRELSLKQNSDIDQANALALLGNIYQTKDQSKKAQEFYQQALALARRAGLVEQELAVRINLASLASAAGRKTEALEELARILAKTKDKWHKAYFNALDEKIKIVSQLKQIDNELIKEVSQAYQSANSKGWLVEEGNLAYQLALLYDDLDQSEESQVMFKKAQQAYQAANLQINCDKIIAEMVSRGYDKLISN